MKAYLVVVRHLLVSVLIPVSVWLLLDLIFGTATEEQFKGALVFAAGIALGFVSCLGRYDAMKSEIAGACRE